MMTNTLPSVFCSNPRLHAYLVLSPDKTARTSAAKSMAMTMLCENNGNGDSFCGKCPMCIKMLGGTHPDCIFVSGTEKTSVDDIRKIEDEAYLAPNEASCKVFMLEDADKYNVQSQNALLKIIEEPPKGVKFILTASSRSGLLPTVCSRVCSVAVENRSIDQIKSSIRSAKPGLDEETVTRLSFFVDSYDMADIETLDETLILQYASLAETFLSGKNKNALLTLPSKKEELMLCLQVMMLCLRQLALAKTTGRLESGILSQSQLSACNAKTSLKRVCMLYDVFEESYILADESANVNALISYIVKKAK